MRVKMLNKIPLLLDGVVEDTVPGQEYTVDPSVGDALLRGNDAIEVATTSTTEVATPKKKVAKKKAHRTKDKGAAPVNK